MAAVTTLPEIYQPLIDAPTVKLDRCAVCGRRWPLNEHHIVWRGWGQVVRDGKVLTKPTVTLCGVGSNLGSGGELYCHGRAHHLMLHFRNDRGRLEYAEFDRPTSYMDALERGDWRWL